MWRLFNKIFGWDYIIWENSCDGMVARIRVGGDGRAYFLQYGKYANYLNEPFRGGCRVSCWLTCTPAKYKTDSNDQTPEAK